LRQYVIGRDGTNCSSAALSPHHRRAFRSINFAESEDEFAAARETRRRDFCAPMQPFQQ
jgi:hypothetical protein